MCETLRCLVWQTGPHRKRFPGAYPVLGPAGTLHPDSGTNDRTRHGNGSDVKRTGFCTWQATQIWKAVAALLHIRFCFGDRAKDAIKKASVRVIQS